MGLNVLRKINSKLRFLYRNKKALSASLKRLLCNSLIQPHFDYASLSWFPNLPEKIRKKIQTAQNKCIRFCLQLDNKAHIGIDQLKQISWLNTTDRYKQMSCTSVYKFFNNNCPAFMSEIFKVSHQGNITTRHSYLKLEQPFMKTSNGQNALSFQGSREWNKIPREIKNTKHINSFKHKLKKFYICELENRELRGL